MSNELIVIAPTTALAVLSTDDGIKTLLDNVKANINNMDGGSMKNKTSRAKIRSNAFKATQAFKKINDENILPLIASETAKIQPTLDIIDAIKANQSVLKSGLQQIRKDVNADVDAFEADLQRIEDEKIEAERVATVEREYDFAKVLYNEYLQQVIIGESILTDWENARIEKENADRVIREKQIADDAAAKAKLEAEKAAEEELCRIIDEKKQAERDAENQRKAAIQAERDKEIAETNRLEAIEKAKQDAIDATALFEKQKADNEARRVWQEKETKRLADEAEALAETNRLAAIEQTKIDEANKIAAQKLADDEAEATRKANVKHSNGIKKAIIVSLMEHAGLSKKQATATASALWYGKITNINVVV